MPKPVSSHNWYSIQAAGHGEAEITIYGDIGENFWEPELSNTGRQLVEDIKSIDAEYITVRISSHGGSVKDALEIVNALRRHTAAVTTEIDAVAFSAASMIAIGAADTVRMADNALLMLHAPMTGTFGNSQEMRRAADMLDKYAEAMAAVYVRNGVAHADALALLLDGVDHYYTASEATDAGFVDEITESMPIAASFDLTRYTNLPAAAAAFIRNKESTKMPDKTKQKPAAPEPSANDQKVVDIDNARREGRNEAVEAIAARNKNVRDLFKDHLSAEGVKDVLDKVIDDPKITEEEAGKMLLKALAKGSESLNPGGHAPRVGADESDKRVEGMTQALLARVGAEKHDTSNPWRGFRLHEMARATLEAAGFSVTGLAPEEFAAKALTRHAVSGMQTSSDFPIILENTMHKLVLMGFNAQSSKWDRFCKIGDVSDFRSWARIVPGLIGNLDGVNENGEYLNKNIPDGEKNTISASRKGNIINITPEVIINDDTGYIQDIAVGLGMAGNRAIDRGVFTLLESNPTLSDGVALFHASHGNLAGTAGVPSVAAFDAMRVAMAAQVAPGDDKEPLDIQPWVSVSHTTLEGDIKVINDSIYDPDSSNKLQKPNKVRGLVQDMVGSPRLTSTTAWYGFADPSIAPVIEVVFLNGQREPRVVEEENFRTSGLAVKVELPFGVGAIDYRGGYKNAGV